MAKFSPASDEVNKLINDVANELNLINYGVDFEGVCVDKAKVVAEAKKASAVTEWISKRDSLVLVIVYEEAFDQLNEQQKYLTIRMAMDKVSYDTEKDKLKMDCPTITIPVGFYEKYKQAAVDTALLGQYLIAQTEEKKKEEEAAKKALKTKNKKNNF